jgi:predicted DCC family thiol-disulfide oxidoreductase YuxK
VLKRWDRAGRVAAVPFQDGAALAALAIRLPRANLEGAMHLVHADGHVFVGAAAVPPLLRSLPGGPLLAGLFVLPGISRAAAAVYQWIARNRHRLPCGSAVCRRAG